MQAAREMYAKSYFALGAEEKNSIDQLVIRNIAGNFQALTPDLAMFQAVQKPVGFQNSAGEKQAT